MEANTLNDILGAFSFYVGDLYTDEEGNFDTTSCVNGYFPIIATRGYAVYLLSETKKLYKGILNDESIDISASERDAIQEKLNKLLSSLEEISSVESFFVVIGGQSESYGNMYPMDCYAFINKLNGTDLSSAVKEWLNTYHSSLVVAQDKIFSILDQIDCEFNELVSKVSDALGNYYEPYFDTDPKGENKFVYFVKVSDALAKLRETLEYYEDEEVAEEMDESEHQNIVNSLKKDIELVEGSTSLYCVIRDGFDEIYEEVEVTELLYILKAPSFLELSNFLNDFHGETDCVSYLQPIVSNFVVKRVKEIVARNLICR